jgi:hypothetical protein
VSRFYLIAVLLALGVVGCNSISPSELVGTWIVKEISRQRLPSELRKVRAEIVLDANGGFSTNSWIPEGLLHEQIVGIPLLRGRGTWRLMRIDGEQKVALDFRAIADSRGQHDVDYGTQLNISRTWSAPVLFYFQGDPDNGRRIEFERK